MTKKLLLAERGPHGRSNAPSDVLIVQLLPSHPSIRTQRKISKMCPSGFRTSDLSWLDPKSASACPHAPKDTWMVIVSFSQLPSPCIFNQMNLSPTSGGLWKNLGHGFRCRILCSFDWCYFQNDPSKGTTRNPPDKKNVHILKEARGSFTSLTNRGMLVVRSLTFVSRKQVNAYGSIPNFCES